MQTVSRRLRSKLKQVGQGMAEYIIILAVVVVAGIGIFASLGDTVANQAAAIALELAGEDGTAAITKAKANATSAKTDAIVEDTLADFATNGQ